MHIHVRPKKKKRALFSTYNREARNFIRYIYIYIRSLFPYVDPELYKTTFLGNSVNKYSYFKYILSTFLKITVSKYLLDFPEGSFL
jgi:hypothetical protein